MTTSEKVAYLKGLAEGYGLDSQKKEGKILSTILDILEDLALDQQDITDQLADMGESLDAVSEDLEDVEKLLFDDDGEDEEGDPEEVVLLASLEEHRAREGEGGPRVA